MKRAGPIRNAVTRFRTKSGELKLPALSADRIQFDGQRCGAYRFPGCKPRREKDLLMLEASAVHDKDAADEPLSLANPWGNNREPQRH